MSVGIVAVAVIAAALALALVLLRGRTSAPLTEESAAQAARTEIPGFTVRETLIGDDRRAALVVGEHRRVALVTSRSKAARPRELRWSDIRATEGGLHVAAERGRGTVFLAGVDVLDVRRAGEDEWRRR